MQRKDPNAAGEGQTRAQRTSDPAQSLDQRIEQKLRAAARALAALDTTDPRARLLQIAILRRDEALLDGVLSEIASGRAPGGRAPGG